MSIEDEMTPAVFDFVQELMESLLDMAKNGRQNPSDEDHPIDLTPDTVADRSVACFVVAELLADVLDTQFKDYAKVVFGSLIDTYKQSILIDRWSSFSDGT